jgi:2-dehydro-3-deoxyphosphogluconate aldolase / (4S)-4-hydroxy-2-oxoglutarate aldolase
MVKLPLAISVIEALTAGRQLVRRPKLEALLAEIRATPVIPVVTVDDARHSIQLARTLVEAGLPIVEVTLRTESALDAIAAMVKAVPEAVVGAGTIVSPTQIAEVVEAGAKFLVSPGTPPKLADALAGAPVPVLPGCATVSEAMALVERGFELLKFFPAVPSGGISWLKSVFGPLPQARFCPTGGLDNANAGDFLALPNVICVGGAWMAPADAIAAGDFDRIARFARAAAMIGKPG